MTIRIGCWYNTILVTTTRATVMSVADEPHAAGAISAINLKLPPFWPSDPHLWFAQVEAQFSTRGITAQKTKYEYVVASLSPEFATQVRDLILRVPATSAYDTLKRQLIARTALPAERRLQQLFQSTELGDQRPSQLLRRMQQLLAEDAAGLDSTLLREMFLQRLPSNVRMVLASAGEGKTLEELAQLADRIITAAPFSVAGATNPQPPGELDELRTEIAKLRETIATLATSTPPARHRSPSPRRPSRLPSPPPRLAPTGMCWYHSRFGARARKCTPPCSYSGNDRAST